MEAVKVVWAVLQVLGVLNWAPDHGKAETFVFQSADQLAKVWVADGGKAEEVPVRYDEIGELRVFNESKQKTPPKVDFDKHTVLAVFGGEKPTAGCEVRIEKVLEAEDGKSAAVIYRETQPEGAAAAVLTYPRHVVVVKKLTGKVTFVKVGTDEAKALEAQLKK